MFSFPHTIKGKLMLDSQNILVKLMDSLLKFQVCPLSCLTALLACIACILGTLREIGVSGLSHKIPPFPERAGKAPSDRSGLRLSERMNARGPNRHGASGRRAQDVRIRPGMGTVYCLLM